MKQAIYPSKTTGKVGAPARGPDDLGGDRHWQVRGARHDTIALRLEVVDAKVTVSVTNEATELEKVWESRGGWARYDYCVAGTFNKWKAERMTMDESAPGIFRFRVEVGMNRNQRTGDYAESFQVLIDGAETATI